MANDRISLVCYGVISFVDKRYDAIERREAQRPQSCPRGAQPDNSNIASMLIVQILILHMAENLLSHVENRAEESSYDQHYRRS